MVYLARVAALVRVLNLLARREGYAMLAYLAYLQMGIIP